MQATQKHSAKANILEATLSLIRAATTADELCAAAGMTKGAFYRDVLSKGCGVLSFRSRRRWAQIFGGMRCEFPTVG
jgi:TetR/AcrR family transcriptional repressor of nem operon